MHKILLRYIIIISLFVPIIKTNAQWVGSDLPSSGHYVQKLLSFSGYLFAGTYGDTTCCLFRSTDNGINWEPSNNGLPVSNIRAILAKGNVLFLGLYGKGVFTSIDSGKTWHESNSGLTNLNINVLEHYGNSVFAVSNRVFRSTDDGIHWEPISGIYSGLVLTSLAIIDSTFLLGTGGDGIWLSTDSCKTWTKKYISGWSNTAIGSIKVIDKKILIGAHSHTFPSGPFYDATFVSDDGGNSWQQILNKEATSFFISGNEIFMTISYVSGELYRTNSNFTSWDTFNENLTSLDYLTSIESHEDYIFVGGGTFPGVSYIPRVWRRLISEITNINDNENINISSSFSLFQNFPNPFNPITKISWQAPVSSWQTLKIFDMLGREIVTLVDEFRLAGQHEINFDASNLPSGVYLYKIQTGSFVKTKKMILMK